MKIIISSNAHWANTGYGTQTKSLIQALLGMGHEVAEHAWWGLLGGIIRTGMGNGVVTVYPRFAHEYGGDTYIAARHFGADLVITLQDVWVLPSDYAERLPCPWAPWFPIDGDPLPPPVRKMVERAAYPIVYSLFGASKMEEAGIPYYYIPHAIDTSVFRPYDQREARRQLNIPDDIFLVAMVAANQGFPSRKSYPEAIQAFKYFYDQHPDAFLYLHTEIQPVRAAGLNLGEVVELTGLPDSAHTFINIEDYLLGIDPLHLALVYSAADVLLAPSMGEGFGLPIAEAQACGCMVITQDCTSMTELTINGHAIKPLQPFHTPLGNWQYTASVDRIVEALEWAYQMRSTDEAAAMRQAGIQHFQENYDWQVVAERHWRPFLEMVEDTR